MTKCEQLFSKIKDGLSLLSPEVNERVSRIDCDEINSEITIVLKSKTNLRQFCALLYASGYFHENDNIKVIY